jgi:hypothetical protein
MSALPTQPELSRTPAWLTSLGGTRQPVTTTVYLASGCQRASDERCAQSGFLQPLSQLAP